MMIKKSFSIISVVLLGVLTVGCGNVTTETPGKSSAPQNKASLQELKGEITNTVCSVKEARVITQENVDDFHDLALKLSYYEGKQEDQIHKVAYELKVTADSWEQNLNQDLGEENAQALTQMCETVESYANEKQS